jgi:hypothetical protein
MTFVTMLYSSTARSIPVKAVLGWRSSTPVGNGPQIMSCTDYAHDMLSELCLTPPIPSNNAKTMRETTM